MIDRVGAQGARGVPEHRHHLGPRRARRDEAPASGIEGSAAGQAGAAFLAGAYSEQSRASFTFVTADGDTVTLQSSQSREYAYAGYAGQGMSGTLATASASSSFRLSVDGQLDTEEVQDIRKALQFLQRAGQDGQIDARELATFANRQDIDSLKSITGSVESSRSEVALSAYA